MRSITAGIRFLILAMLRWYEGSNAGESRRRERPNRERSEGGSFAANPENEYRQHCLRGLWK
jgi:hypothetical protein